MCLSVAKRPRQTRALSCAFRTNAVDYSLQSLAGDLHARIAQRQEDCFALARLPKSLGHQGVEQHFDCRRKQQVREAGSTYPSCLPFVDQCEAAMPYGVGDRRGFTIVQGRFESTFDE